MILAAAAQYATLSNAQRRLFETVGLRRVPREVAPSIESYTATMARAAPQAPAGAIVDVAPNRVLRRQSALLSLLARRANEHSA
jgi:hypothetical protein